MKTYQAKLRRQQRPDGKRGPMEPANFTHEWFHVDAADQVLGRLATRIATVLMGKHKPTYTRHIDVGDFVVVTNCGRVAVTREKTEGKMYRHHTGFLGGLKTTSFAALVARKPTEPLRLAVRRMLPKTALGRKMLRKLKLYAGTEHPHAAQQVQPFPDYVR